MGSEHHDEEHHERTMRDLMQNLQPHTSARSTSVLDRILTDGGPDTKDHGWLGPGSCETSRSMEKDKKLVNAAIFQWKFNTTIPPFLHKLDGTREFEGAYDELSFQKIAPFANDL
jgi:hypothetical protein